MNTWLNPNWVKVSKDEFDRLMQSVNYFRDWFADGAYYYIKHLGKEKRVGLCRDDGSCFIDPEFFEAS